MKKALLTILASLGIVTTIMAIYYFVQMVIVGDLVHGFTAGVSYAVCMLCGALISFLVAYTVKVNRNNVDDKNQITAMIILVLLGVAISTTVSVWGIGEHLPIAIGYYLQTVFLLGILITLRLDYRGKH